MAEYISRMDALKAMKTLPVSYDHSADLDECCYAVAKVPAADVAPVVHGRWISWEQAGNFIPSPDRYECSVCHDAAQVLVNGWDLLSEYCPNCGAKMDLEDT